MQQNYHCDESLNSQFLLVKIENATLRVIWGLRKTDGRRRTAVNHLSGYVKGDSALIDLFSKGNYDAVATDDAKLIRRLRNFEIPPIEVES